MWKNSEIESGVGSEPATSKGAAYWLSRPTQMVLAAAGAASSPLSASAELLVFAELWVNTHETDDVTF